jgi:hypothetical protein
LFFGDVSRVIVAYIDEAGDVGALSNPALANDQPTLTIAALLVEHSRLESLTRSYLALKRRFFPGLNYPSSMLLDTILPEVKGADLRRQVALGNRNQKRHALLFLDEVLGLLALHQIRILARVWIKAPGQPFDGRAVYTTSIQRIYEGFDHYLASAQDYGFCIADSRRKGLNVPVAHSIFTQKYSQAAPAYPRVIELPSFGHSDNHAGLQLADLVASAVLCPIACYTYCTGHVANLHVQPNYLTLKGRYAQAIRALQYRFQDTTGKWRGGITVSDGIGQTSSARMFAP